MARTTLLTTLLALGLAAPAYAGHGNGKSHGQGGHGKAQICHVPPGNPDAAHTLSVGAPAVDAHLRHGDSEGACEGKARRPRDDDDHGRDDDRGHDDDDDHDGPADDIEGPADDIEGPADDIGEEPAKRRQPVKSPTRETPTRTRQTEVQVPVLEDLRTRAQRAWRRAQRAFASLF